MRSVKWWISAGAGAILAGGFPPLDLPWPTIPLAIALWFLATLGAPLRTSLWRSLAFAMGFNLALLHWMVIVGFDAWFLLALLQSLYFLFVPVVRHYARTWGALVVPLAWVAQDWFRDHAPFAAFGWGQLAYAKIDAPWAVLAPYGGQAVVTAAIVYVGLATAYLLHGALPHRLIATGSLILGLTAPQFATTPMMTTPARLALVQGGVDHTGLGFIGDRNAVLYRHRDLTARELNATSALAVVWPENAADADPFTDSKAAAAVHDAANAAGKPILFGAVLTDSNGRRNVSLLARPFEQDFEIVYQKQRLVPFGEFLPFRDFLTRVTDRVEFLPIDFVAGNDAANVQLGNSRYGIVICFEIADEQLVRKALASGQQTLIVQTNNATYAGTGQSEQQLRISQFRARSFRVPVIVVSTNGPSAVIDERGRVVSRIAEGDVGVIYSNVAGSA